MAWGAQLDDHFVEIQELRHQAEANAPGPSTSTASIPGEGSDDPTTGGTGITTLDQALMGLEARLEAISGSIASIDETLGPHIKDGETPTRATPNLSNGGELLAALLRKHAELKAEWETVQTEADTLQSELREDKWLAVFRSVGEQSDTMMNSLEKALANCQVRSSCPFFVSFSVNSGISIDVHTSGSPSGSRRHYVTGFFKRWGNARRQTIKLRSISILIGFIRVQKEVRSCTPSFRVTDSGVEGIMSLRYPRFSEFLTVPFETVSPKTGNACGPMPKLALDGEASKIVWPGSMWKWSMSGKS